MRSPTATACPPTYGRPSGSCRWCCLPGQRVRPVAADRLGPHPPRRPHVPARLPAEGDAERAERTRSGQALRGPRRQGRAARPGAADTRPAQPAPVRAEGTQRPPHPRRRRTAGGSSTSTARRCCTSRARARPATRTARTASAGRSSSATANCGSPHRTAWLDLVPGDAPGRRRRARDRRRPDGDVHRAAAHPPGAAAVAGQRAHDPDRDEVRGLLAAAVRHDPDADDVLRLFEEVVATGRNLA